MFRKTLAAALLFTTAASASPPANTPVTRRGRCAQDDDQRYGKKDDRCRGPRRADAGLDGQGARACDGGASASASEDGAGRAALMENTNIGVIPGEDRSHCERSEGRGPRCRKQKGPAEETPRPHCGTEQASLPGSPSLATHALRALLAGDDNKKRAGESSYRATRFFVFFDHSNTTLRSGRVSFLSLPS